MRATLVMLGVLATGPALALEYGGGGIQLHQAFVPVTLGGWAGGADVAAPGLMNCLGGLGFGVRNGVRAGAMGAWCSGARARTGFGGLQGGWQSARAGVYSTAHATVGAGWMGLDDGRQHLRSAYIFARPELGLGVPVGTLGAFEFGAFAMLPVPVSQSLNGDSVSGPSFPHAGLQVSFLFGDFSRQKKTNRLGRPQDQTSFHGDPPPLGTPESPPPPQPDPPAEPAPVQPCDVNPEDCETTPPLAIPEPRQPRRPPED